MKFVVDGYEIEIKARRTHEKRCSKDATMSFMNSVGIWMREAGAWTAFENRNDDGFYDELPDAFDVGKRVGDRMKEESFKIHDQLDAYGCYDDIR